MTETAAPKRKFNWWRVVLVVSLALNLLIAGLVVGVAMRFRDAPPPRELAERDVGYGAFIAAFEGDDRRALGRAYRSEMPDRDELRLRYRTQIDEVLTALRSEPFDAARFQSALHQRQEELEHMQERGQVLLIGQLSGMDQAARLRYADKLEHILTRFRDHDDDDDHGHHGDRDRD